MTIFMCALDAYAQYTEKSPTKAMAYIMVSLFSIATLALAGNHASAQSVNPEVTELEEIFVEDEGEPESELPLGIGISGKTLHNAPGSSGDPVRALQTLPGLIYQTAQKTPSFRAGMDSARGEAALDL